MDIRHRIPSDQWPTKPRIGLLGGSFNPAHEGHRALSLYALRAMALDEVWWLVVSDHPFKVINASLGQRVQGAEKIANHPRLRVSSLVNFLDHHSTAHMLDVLCHGSRQSRYVWLVGADNLANMHLWHHWPMIFSKVPVAVFNRYPFGFRSLVSTAAERYRRARRSLTTAKTLADQKPPAWIFFPNYHNQLSSTGIRALLENDSGGLP